MVEHNGDDWGNFIIKLEYVADYNTTTSNLSMYDTPIGCTWIANSGDILDIRSELEGVDTMQIHGWILWVAWGMLGFI